jgi:hypothetical protein
VSAVWEGWSLTISQIFSRCHKNVSQENVRFREAYSHQTVSSGKVPALRLLRHDEIGIWPWTERGCADQYHDPRHHSGSEMWCRGEGSVYVTGFRTCAEAPWPKDLNLTTKLIRIVIMKSSPKYFNLDIKMSYEQSLLKHNHRTSISRNSNWYARSLNVYHICPLWLLSFSVLPSSTYLFTAGVEGIFVISFDHTQAHTTGARTPLDEGSARRRDLYLTTQTVIKDKHPLPPGGIRTHDPSKPSTADLRLRPRGHWDRLVVKSFRIPSLFYLPTVRVEVVYFHLITLRHTPQSVELLWTRDRPVAETSTWQHKHS